MQLYVAEAEKRYCKLLSGVELTRDFFFSYTYPTWRTLQVGNVWLQTDTCTLADTWRMLQANMTSPPDGSAFDSMFVWNDFLTRCCLSMQGMAPGRVQAHRSRALCALSPQSGLSTSAAACLAEKVTGVQHLAGQDACCTAGPCAQPAARTGGRCPWCTASGSSAPWQCWDAC